MLLRLVMPQVNDRADIQALKYGIDGNPFTAPQPVGEIHRLTVYQDQVNGCMGHAHGLGRLFIPIKTISQLFV